MTPSEFTGSRTYVVGEYQYLMTYFEAQLTGYGGPTDVAAQFTALVAHYANSGFEFYRCDEVPYRVNPGCLGGLFAKVTFGRCTIVSFRKRMTTGI